MVVQESHTAQALIAVRGAVLNDFGLEKSLDYHLFNALIRHMVVTDSRAIDA